MMLDRIFKGSSFYSIGLKLAAFVVIFLSTLHFPGPMEHTALDWSWTGALSFFSANHYQFGPDVIYTYGPLGYLMQSSYAGVGAIQILIGRLAVSAMVTITLVALASYSRSILVTGLLTVCIFFLASYETDSLILTALTIAACLSLRSGASKAWLSYSAFMSAFFSLAKFTFFAYSIFWIFVALIILINKREYRNGLVVLIAYIGGILLLWTTVGSQKLSSFPEFLRSGFDTASGYSQAMSTLGPTSLVIPVYVQIALLGIMVLVVTVLIRPRVLAIALSTVLAAAIFLIWKEGYVRADYDHVMVVPLSAQILSLLMLAIGMRENVSTKLPELPAKLGVFVSSLPIISYGLLVLTFATSFYIVEIVGNAQDYSDFTNLRRATSNIKANLFTITHLSDDITSLDNGLSNARSANAFPQFSKLIGNQSVDIYGDDVGIALLNQWNYAPRPTVQSFAAYTPYLDNRNKRFVESSVAPEFYLMNVRPIDDRLFAESDTGAFIAILKRYSLVASEKGYFLFKKRDKLVSSPDSPIVIKTGTGTIGESITFDELPPEAMDRIQINLRQTVLGWFHSLFLKPAWAQIRIVTKSGQLAENKLPLTLARKGFIINPSIQSDVDLYHLLTGQQENSIQSVSVQIPQEYSAYFDNNFSFTIERLPQSAPQNMVTGLLAPVIGFSAEPSMITSPFPPRILTVGGHDVFSITAPSSLQFAIPSGANRVVGNFGVMPGAFDTGAATKVVKFTITQLTANGQISLLERQLTSSGEQSFDLQLINSRSSKLELKAGCTPTCDAGWSYWQGISFENTPAKPLKGDSTH